MPALGETLVRPAPRVRGRIRVPGDKSISHRYAMLASLATGRSTIHGYAPGADCASTLGCLRGLGVDVTVTPGDQPGKATVSIAGRGLRGLQAPAAPLDARNSGTTMRLMTGILSAHPFTAVLVGDASLSRRPMRRVIEPLARMGARIIADQDRAPLTISGGSLTAIDYTPPVPSAQVKSAILFAGMQTEGTTTVHESVPTRDHTELALRAFGASIDASGDGRISVTGGAPLRSFEATVPGDLSSATFWAVAAAGLPGSEIEIEDLGLNRSRVALFDVLRRAGADVQVSTERVTDGEFRGSVRVRHDDLRPLVLTPAEVPGVIDELPALAALATFGGELHVTGAAELRVKESDRISALAAGFRSLGGEIDEFPDGFHITGRTRLRGGTADAAGDHRLAMAFAIAALGAEQPSTITGADAVSVSYPGFFETLDSVTRDGR
jgi:3-phosphoshikimate 1-carboxyvinyltransferase